MELDAQTFYGPGNTTNTAQVKAPSGLDDLRDLIKDLLKRKLSQTSRPAGPMIGSAPHPVVRQSNEDRLRENLLRLQAERQQMENTDYQRLLNAKRQAPMRKIGWLGPEYFDPLGMNAYERSIYMPNQGSFTVTPEDSARAEGDLAELLAGEKDRRENWDENSFAGSGANDSGLQARVAELESALLAARGGR